MKNSKGDSHLRVYVTSFQEEITGSNTIIKAVWSDGRSVNFAIDCGLFQEEGAGWNDYNNKMFPYVADSIDFLIATHVHIDHTGRIPYLVKCGFLGRIYTSKETEILLPVMLNDSYSQIKNDFGKDYLMWKREVDKRKKKIKRKKEKQCLNYDKKKRKYKFSMKDIYDAKPKMLFDKVDITKTLRAIETIDNYESFSPCEGIEITFLPNAHINGSVVVNIRILDENEEENFLITGDLGTYNTLTKVRTEIPKDIAKKVTTILAESTYGYEMEPRNTLVEQNKHCEILNNSLRASGSIIYLVNALERSSRVLQDLKELQNDVRTKETLKGVPIYLDTTLGIKCNTKYIKLLGTEFLPKNFKTIGYADRNTIMKKGGPQILICTSPRFIQGSFQNYAKWAIENPRCAIIFTSYTPDNITYFINQKEGYSFHYHFNDVNRIVKRCKTYKFRCYSAHVSPLEMGKFLAQFINAKIIFFNHGTTEGKNANKDRFETDSTITHALLYGRTAVIENSKIIKVY